MDRVCVIANPNASKGRGRRGIASIVSEFGKHGILAEVKETGAVGDAQRLALEACLEGFRTVVAAGGDGCVNEVANGILKSGKSVHMGIVPLGRGNDFAWFAGIPTSIDKSVSLIAEGSPSLVDVGYLECDSLSEGRFFLNGTGIGFEPAINFKAASYRHLNGMPSYIVAFFHCLMHLPKAYVLTVALDGEEWKMKSQQVSISNGRRMGSAFILAPYAQFDDGLIDLVYAKHPVTRRLVIPMVMNFFRGTQLEKCPFMEMKRGRCVEVRSAESDMVIHTDGEFVSLNASWCRVTVRVASLSLFHGRPGVGKMAKM